MEIRRGYTIAVPSTVGDWHAVVMEVNAGVVRFFLSGDDTEHEIPARLVSRVIGPAYEDEDYNADGDFIGIL